jgi:hypothetical protein
MGNAVPLTDGIHDRVKGTKRLSKKLPTRSQVNRMAYWNIIGLHSQILPQGSYCSVGVVG